MEKRKTRRQTLTEKDPNFVTASYEECYVDVYNDEKDDEIIKKEEPLVKAKTLLTGESQTIYGFKTPKRKEALTKAALGSVHSTDRCKTKGRQNTTPQLSNKQNIPLKPKSVVTHLHAINTNSTGDDDSSEESSNDDEKGGSENEEEFTKVEKSGDLLDIYFETHSNKSVTSDRTLSSLNNPKMEQNELRKHLKESQSKHITETVNLYQETIAFFDEWMFQMLCGFNVLCYGLGSKIKVLRQFREECLTGVPCLVINGFFPSITIKEILNNITLDLLKKDFSFKSIIDQSAYIKKHYDNTNKSNKLFIIIHNIEGSMLRSPNTQAVLAEISSARHIHVIASIDHINGPLIWDQNRASLFSWLWYDVTTFQNYNQETSYENSLMVQQSGTLALSSLMHVLKSLTPNAHGIFNLLAKQQLDNSDNSNYQGYSINDLYVRCREMFLVNSDLTLRSQLTEFKDHKLVKSKKGNDGIEYLSVALDESTLRHFLTNEDN